MKTWIGRTDTKSICLSLEACEEILQVIMKYDPDGVDNGSYFIDTEQEDN